MDIAGSCEVRKKLEEGLRSKLGLEKMMMIFGREQQSAEAAAWRGEASKRSRPDHAAPAASNSDPYKK
jgi:uncharacterized protein (DUF1697 family)